MPITTKNIRHFDVHGLHGIYVYNTCCAFWEGFTDQRRKITVPASLLFGKSHGSQSLEISIRAAKSQHQTYHSIPMQDCGKDYHLGMVLQHKCPIGMVLCMFLSLSRVGTKCFYLILSSGWNLLHWCLFLLKGVSQGSVLDGQLILIYSLCKP